MPLCRCILLKFYIKPQLRLERELAYCVVSYRNSTSNHNYGEGIYFHVKLYLIEILHQTTTAGSAGRTRKRLYLIEILHQTTTFGRHFPSNDSCILSKFYIKPQRLADIFRLTIVVSYRNSTSNHNRILLPKRGNAVVSYRNSTSNHNFLFNDFCAIAVVSYRNSTSNHNAGSKTAQSDRVVSYRNSTSNHNSFRP